MPGLQPSRRELTLALALMGLVACSTNRGTRAKDEGRPPAASSSAPPAAPAPEAVTSAEPASTPDEGGFFEPDPSAQATVMARPNAPNMRYAKLDHASCDAELKRRAIPVEYAKHISGVVTPVWLRGPLHGIAIHSGLSPKSRIHSSVEIFDCRLILAMDDFATQLAAHDVVEIVHMSAYRPPSGRGCTPKYKGKQHCAALAVDVGSFKKKDGTTLVVDRDFHGKIGLATCAGTAAPKPSTPAAEELWSYVCDAARRGTFHVMLTPNYNLQHHNHFHLEITPEVNWMLVH